MSEKTTLEAENLALTSKIEVTFTQLAVSREHFRTVSLCM